MKFKPHNNYGFTLIELLVVISIISFLATLAVASLQDAREKARDTRRLSDMRQIITALELYYDDYSSYPDENSSNGSWENSYEDNGDFIDLLKDNGYMQTVPIDPINESTGSYYYSYYRYPAGNYNCDSSKGGYYVLGIRNLEAINNGDHPSNPGWTCPDRDWSTEFEWVTGAFINP